MKERPISLLEEEVRALHAGTLTQLLRRAVHVLPPKAAAVHAALNPEWFRLSAAGDHPGIARCSYGQAGDRLWVRETWAMEGTDGTSPLPLQYRADRHDWLECSRWRSPVTMPRWASRTVLEILSTPEKREMGGWWFWVLNVHAVEGGAQ